MRRPSVLLISALLAVGVFCAEAAAEPVPLRGILLEKGTRRPLAGMNIYVLPSKVKAVTGVDGRFEIAGVAPAPGEEKNRIVVNSSGYRRLDRELVTPQPEGELRLYLEPIQQSLIYETIVVGKNERRDDSRRTLNARAAAALPGSGGDPVRALQNLPGINRPAPFQSNIIIQGSSPQETRYQIDGNEVPNAFHFGGLTSVIPPESLDRVDYLSAGYGPEAGRANGGLVGIHTRSPRTDRLHGIAYADVISAGAVVEGPIDEKSSFLAGVRRSYIGDVLKAVVRNNPRFDLTAAPAYQDLTLLYERDVTHRDRLRLLAIGSYDHLEFLLDQPSDADPALRGSLENTTAFIRFIPQLIHRHSSRTVSRWSLAPGKDWILVDAGESFFYLKTSSLTARGEVERRNTETWTAQWGFDNRYTWASVDVNLRRFSSKGGVANPFSSGENQRITAEADYANTGLYWRNELKPSVDSGWTFLPSGRLDYFRATGEWHPQPRLGTRYRISPDLEARVNGGLYVQPPQEQQLDPTIGNPALKSPRAWHLSVSAEKDFRGGSSKGFAYTPAVFYKYLDRLVGAVYPGNFANNTRGRAYGFESLLRGDIGDWSGWLSYTLSRSTRITDGEDERVFNYDQTHVMTAIAGYDLGAGWKISGRFRYATGNPYTPVTGGVLDADNDVYVPVRGAIYSERQPGFLQADLRVDKRWIYDTWILNAYLDIQNATNRENIEAVRYSYDFSQRTQVSGLPILPSFGLQAEF